MSANKAVLFDLDGTLLNTLPDIQACVNDILRGHGYPEIGEEQTKSYIGDGARQLIERALPADAADIDACYEEFRTQFPACGNRLTRLYADEMKVLKALKARGVRLGVVTNKPQDAAERVIAQFFHAGFFDFIGGDTGMFPCKPDPSLALYAALKLRTSPAVCAFVGDGETDARVARNAGMYGVSALWGYRTRMQLEAAGAAVFAENFLQLQNILEKFI